MSRRDYVAAAGLSLLSLVLCGIHYWYPPERYFDEIYYPRSGAEFLQWQPQYEWTHPPLTKLLIAFSMLLWGGMHSQYGDTGYGWRFLNVVVGAVLVFVLYVFAKRLTKSTAFASLAAALLVFDGFHFTQSRIATPEITVALFSLLILYGFYRYWNAISNMPERPQAPWQSLVAGGALSVILGAAVAGITVGGIARQHFGGVVLIAVLAICFFYTLVRLYVRPRPAALGWLWFTAIACGLGAASKWNDLFDVVLVFGFALGIVLLPKPKWRIELDAFVAIVLGTTIAIYLASYIPFFYTPPESFIGTSDLNAFMSLQQQMFSYHDITVTHNAPHPYSSKWWEWPLLIQPIAYWYKDFRTGAAASNPNACCVGEILALPNPAVWWFGLVTIPFLGYLAWLRKNRGYILLFVAYFAQWLPWIASPRMLFEYHFFPNLAVIVLADTVALQWLWERAGDEPQRRRNAKIAIYAFLALAIVLFLYFYPVLAGDHIRWNLWNARMWLRHWIIGPG